MRRLGKMSPKAEIGRKILECSKECALKEFSCLKTFNLSENSKSLLWIIIYHLSKILHYELVWN